MQQTLFNQAWLKKARKFSPSFSLRFEQSKRSLLIFASCSILTACASLPRFSSLPDFDKEVSAGLEDISIAAIGLVGVPYRYGGNTPAGGFDCSGLIAYVFNKSSGIQLPRTIQQMSNAGRGIGQQAPAPGDLVFFNTTGERYSHAGIYVGKGRFVHAPSAGGTVRLDRIDAPYWASRYTEARRVASATTGN